MTEFIRRNFFIFLFSASYIFFKYFNIEVFPDLFHFSSINSSNYFELIIGATTSVFGILIAIVLLTFEFVKDISFKRENENILNKSEVTNLISLALSVIFLSFISYATIEDFKESNNLTIAYYLGFLFIYFIFSIFPSAKKILGSANILKNTLNEIKNLSLEQLREILTLGNDKFISRDNNLILVRIRHKLINSVMQSDFEAYTSILESLNSKAIELIGDGQDREKTEIVFRGCTFIWNSGNFEAFRVGNHQFYETVWECIEELYEYAAKEKVDLLNYEYIDFFVMDFIKFLSRNKLGDSLAKGAKVVANAFKLNLKYNCPPQEQINDLYYIFEEKNDEERLPHYINSSIQWNKINELIYHLNTIQTSAIEIVDKELFETCKFELERIIQEISYKSFPDLKIYQEAYIIVKIINHQTYNAFEANQENLFKESMWTFGIKTRFISDIVKDEKFYVGRILEQISDFIIKSQRNERLDYFFSLNDWGALGRHISKFYFVNDIAKKAIDFILDTLDVLKKEIEENQLPNQAQNYIETKKQFESIKKCLIRDNEGQEIPVIERIDKALDSYVEVVEKKDFRIVKWDDEE